MKNSKKTVFIIVGIILTIIASYIVSYFLLMYVVLPGLFGPSQVPEDERIVEFDDGTVLERTGGPTYTHTLYDGYEFVKGDGRFEGRIYHDDNEYSVYGYIMRYAYDTNGNIAYRQLEDTSYYGEEYLFEWDNYNVVADRTILYNCKTDTETEFDSMNELYAYCDSRGIELGAWYYPVGYTPVEEVIQLESGGWTVASNALDYSVVDNGSEELFSGFIDKYFECDNYFGFHFQHIENGDYDIAQNPVITYSTDNVVGKKYAGLLFFYNDVYVDKYVLINTDTDEYTVFDTKKELKQYAKDIDLDVKWNKIEY
ncbi:MAG: hypothetical protein IJZ35_09390 [Clostridia bacterium]|nr:hypothetical protein [Clostridia bacterium]